MPCLVVIAALFLPRVVLLFIWLLTSWTHYAFEGYVWPLLGWLFMPYTTICYIWAACATEHNINGKWVALIVIGVLFDLAQIGASNSDK